MLWALRGHLPVYLCYEEPLKGKAVLREAFKRQCCATVPFRGGFCAARANEEQPEQRPERRRGFCATSACRRGFCATGDRKRPLVAQDALEVLFVAQACRSDFVSLLIQFQWGGLHGRLPIAQIGLESAARRKGLPLIARHQRGRKIPFGQPERHQGGRKGFIGQLARHQGGRKGSMREERTIWTASEAPGRQERIHWTACEAPGRQERIHWTACERGTREAGKNHLDSLGCTRGTREAGREAPGRLRGPSEEDPVLRRPLKEEVVLRGPQRNDPSTGSSGSEHRLVFKVPLGAQDCLSQGGTPETGKDHLDSLRGTREAGKDSLDLRRARAAGKVPSVDYLLW